MIRKLFAGTYADYLLLQASKATEPKFREQITADRMKRVDWFLNRFKSALEWRKGTAICLGARYGEEVEALQSLGWDAHGIDLLEYSPWVFPGDMNEPITDHYDLIYTNAFDHCWEPAAFIDNILNALTPDGLVMLHISTGKAGQFETQEWDSIRDVVSLIPKSYVVSVNTFYGLDVEIIGGRHA